MAPQRIAATKRRFIVHGLLVAQACYSFPNPLGRLLAQDLGKESAFGPACLTVIFYFLSLGSGLGPEPKDKEI